VRDSIQFVTAFVVVAALLPRTSDAAGCESLASLSLSNTTIISAESVAAGTFRLPPDSPRADSSFFTTFGKLRAFCRVRGAIEPVKSSHIEFEVWMPSAGWNHKYVGTGNGGFGGTINYYRLAEAVNAGYAASATDTGHRGPVGDTSWAPHHPERVIDFKKRAGMEAKLCIGTVVSVLGACAFALAQPPLADFDGGSREFELISVSDDGAQGNNDSFAPLVSADRRFVVFSSRASNLVRRDTNESVDVFIRDRAEDETKRIAGDTSADQPFGFDVTAADITPDARSISLVTRADLRPEQEVGFFAADVYVRDRR
jgi:hypothetical protein